MCASYTVCDGGGSEQSLNRFIPQKGAQRLSLQHASGQDHHPVSHILYYSVTGITSSHAAI